jgi:hypothetical protein
MNTSTKRCALAVASASVFFIHGCGEKNDPIVEPPPPATVTLSGVVAKGAAFEGATITVTNRIGTAVGTTSTPVGADGVYTVNLTPGALAPFIVTATRTGANGETESLVSVVPAVSGSTATANVTPVTHLIASRLATSGDPLRLGAELAVGTAAVDAATVQSKLDEVQAVLGPVLQATGTAGTHPLTGSFSVDGTGYDRLLDSIAITIIPSSPTTVNIEIAVRQRLAEGEAPTAIHFTNLTAVASIPAIPTIDPDTLVEPGTATLIAQHLAQLTSCYALPLSARISSGGTTAADVVAPECRNAFFGNDPALFKTNGRVVGKGKAFNGIFVDAATGTVFSRGTFEFTRANGDLVIGYMSRTPAGNETQDAFVLRRDADGKLKQIGNQYAYPGGVAAYQQLRRFLTLDQSAFDYYSTGYNLNVDHITGGSGVDGSIFDRVVVTSPRGRTLTLKPRAGLSYLALVKPGPVLSNTSVVRLRAEYADTANTADPAVKDTALVFADRNEYTNEVIATIPAQGVWRFDYFLAGNVGSTPDATQHYKTRARALAIPELRMRAWAELGATLLASLRADANPTTGNVPIGDETSIDLNYTVPTGALPPTSLWTIGGYNGGSFNDSITVGSTARAGSILCAPTGAADLHCSAGAGSPYASTAYAVGIYLAARDGAGREFTTFYAMYKLQ